MSSTGSTSTTPTILCAGPPSIGARMPTTDGRFNLSRKAVMEIVKLFLTPDEDLYDKTIEDVFDEEE